MITVVDLKGCRWSLIPIGRYKVSSKGLVERWYLCGRSPIGNYNTIPVPVFTEWWP